MNTKELVLQRKNKKISDHAVRRLPRYLKKLDELYVDGVERLSSNQLGRMLSITPSQIRQDLSNFGEFGQQGYGYNVRDLRRVIAAILGMDRNFTAILVGAGNIGHALIDHFDFNSVGVRLISAFDANPDIVGKSLGDIAIYSIENLKEMVSVHQPDIAILSVPMAYANPVAEILVEAGIKGIWNFTNVELDFPNATTVVENINFSDSLLVLSYYLSNI